MNQFSVPDFPFYHGVFLGSQIAEDDFPELAQRAVEFMRGKIGAKFNSVPQKDWDNLRRAVCALAEVLQDERRTAQRVFDAKPVSEETVGNYSVRYDSSYFSSAEMAFLQNRKQEALRVYLAGIPSLAPLFQVRSTPCSRHM